MRSRYSPGGRAGVAQFRRQLRRPRFAQTPPHAPERFAEPLAAERLQQIIHRRRFERPHRVLVERGDEHHGHARIDQLEHFEAVELRHLDIHEQHVGLVLGHCLHRLEAVRALRHDARRPPPRSRRLAQQPPRQFFIVCDHCSHVCDLAMSRRAFGSGSLSAHGVPAPASGVATRAGSVSVT